MNSLFTSSLYFTNLLLFNNTDIIRVIHHFGMIASRPAFEDAFLLSLHFVIKLNWKNVLVVEDR